MQKINRDVNKRFYFDRINNNKEKNRICVNIN